MPAKFPMSFEEAKQHFPNGEYSPGGYIYVNGVCVYDGWTGLTDEGEEMLKEVFRPATRGRKAKVEAQPEELASDD